MNNTWMNFGMHVYLQLDMTLGHMVVSNELYKINQVII